MCIFSDFWLHFFPLTKILLFYMWYFKTCLNNLFQTSFQVNDLKLPYSQQCLEAGTSRSVPKMASTFLVTSGPRRYPCLLYFCLVQGSNSLQMVQAELELVGWGIHVNCLEEPRLGEERRGAEWETLPTPSHSGIWCPKLVPQVDRSTEG